MVGGVKCRETRGETHLILTEVQQDLPCGWSRCYLRSGGLVAAEVGQCESGSVTTAVWHQRQAEQRGSNVSVGRARVFSSVWQRAGISARGYQRSPWKAGRAAASSRPHRDMDDVFYVTAGGFAICSWSGDVVTLAIPTRPSNDKLGVSKKGLSPLDLPPGLIRTVLSSREPRAPRSQ